MLDERKKSSGENQSNCTTKCPDKQQCVRWVDVNKGDESENNVCRLAGKELRAKTKKAVLTCTGAFQRNASVGNSQVSGIISRDGRRLAVSTPVTRHTDDQVERRKGEAQLSPTMATVFRSCVMRASFMSQDRADFGEAVKSLAHRDHRRLRWRMSSDWDVTCLADHLWL